MVLEATSDGAIVMRQAAVYPIEMYTEERVREFEETNAVPAAMERRVEAYLRKLVTGDRTHFGALLGRRRRGTVVLLPVDAIGLLAGG